VMDGFEFTRELRKVEAWRDIPVIVSTAKDLSADERAGLSGMVEGILRKNACSLEELMEQARVVLATRTDVASTREDDHTSSDRQTVLASG